MPRLRYSRLLDGLHAWSAGELLVCAAILLGPVGYWYVPLSAVSVADVGMNELIKLSLLVVYVLETLGTRKIEYGDKFLFGFITYLIVATSVSAFAVTLGVFSGVTVGPTRVAAQSVELMSWLPFFVYGGRLGRKRPQFAVQLLIFSVTLHAMIGLFQVIAAHLGLSLAWGISLDRGIAETSIGGRRLIRASGVVGEPKGLASLLTVLLVPWLVTIDKGKTHLGKSLTVVGWIVALAFLLTLSASGTVALVLGTLLGLLVMRSDVAKTGRRLAVIVGIGSIVGVVLSLMPGYEAGLEQVAARILGVVGHELGTNPYLETVYISLPVVGEIPFDGTDAVAVAFLRDHLWTSLVGVGRTFDSLVVPYVTTYGGWIEAGQQTAVDPSIGAIELVGRWGLVGGALFVLFLSRVWSRYNRELRAIPAHSEDRVRLEVFGAAAIASCVSLLNIGSGLNVFLMLGLFWGARNSVRMSLTNDPDSL